MSDDLLFSINDVNRWKGGELPYPWLEAQKNILLARCHAQAERLKIMRASDAATARRLNKPL